MSGREEKFHRMNQIREALEKEPRRFEEITALFKGSMSDRVKNRTLQYDLAGLRILGLIELNDDGFYYSAQKKQVYSNEIEYKLALEHSENLIVCYDNFEAGVKETYSEYDLSTIVDMILWPRKSDSGDSSWLHFEAFLNHLKTGYRNEIWLRLMEYKEKREIKNREKAPPENVEVSEKNGFKTWYDPETAVLYDLKYDIGAEILKLEQRIKQGIPLRGYCDACPSIHIKINEDSQQISV